MSWDERSALVSWLRLAEMQLSKAQEAMGKANKAFDKKMEKLEHFVEVTTAQREPASKRQWEALKDCKKADQRAEKPRKNAEEAIAKARECERRLSMTGRSLLRGGSSSRTHPCRLPRSARLRRFGRCGRSSRGSLLASPELKSRKASRCFSRKKEGQVKPLRLRAKSLPLIISRGEPMFFLLLFRLLLFLFRLFFLFFVHFFLFLCLLSGLILNP